MNGHIHVSKRLFVFYFSFFLIGKVSTQWNNVGTNISLNNTYPGNYSFAKDKADILYVAFADLGNQYIVTVKKRVNNGWINVGTPGFITGTGNASGLFYDPGTSIAINPVDNTPYIALSDGDHDNKVSVMKYNGSAWVYVGIPGFSSPSACGVKLVFTSMGVPYVSFTNCYNGSGISVLRFSGGQWNYAGPQNFATGNYLQMTAAPDNTISIAFADQNSLNKISVMKLNGSAWAYAGTPGFSDDAAENISITADSTNALYVSYTDYSHSGKITVKKLASNIWSLLGAPSFSNFDAHFTSLSINKDGVPYVSYVDHVFPVAQKFKNGVWTALGNYIITTTCHYTSILNDTLGNPFVLMALEPSSTLPFVYKYSPCNDSDYHFVAKAELDSSIKYEGGSTTLKVTATGGLPPYTGTGTYTITAGYYTYTITDKNGCTRPVNINVSEPCTENYWNGSVSTTWEDAGNWSCGTVPGPGTKVYVTGEITNYPVIHSKVTCMQLNVSPGITVIVAAGANLDVTGHN